MERRLTPRHRTTRVRLDPGRPVGFYEQCDDRSSEAIRAGSSRHGGAIAAAGSISVTGRVGAVGVLGHHVLRSLAGSDRLSDFDRRTVAIADFLSAVRLDAAADLLMWGGVDGSRFVTAVDRFVKDPTSALVLGGADLSTAPRWEAPVVLTSESLGDADGRSIVSVCALTFAEFVGDLR